MRGNIYNPTDLRVTEMQGSVGSVTVAAGAAGFVSTNVSTIVSGDARFSVWFARATTATQDVGVREEGSGTDTKFSAVAGQGVICGIVRVIGGKVELYRAANNNIYRCVGYIR